MTGDETTPSDRLIAFLVAGLKTGIYTGIVVVPITYVAPSIEAAAFTLALLALMLVFWLDETREVRDS